MESEYFSIDIFMALTSLHPTFTFVLRLTHNISRYVRVMTSKAVSYNVPRKQRHLS